MSYEACSVHQGESATNGCALCKCPACGQPDLNHDELECASSQALRAMARIKKLEAALKAAGVEIPQ